MSAIIGPTTVISVRGKVPAELLKDPSFVYVGRQCAGWPRSIWGNPFRPGDPARESIRRACLKLPGEWDRLWALEPAGLFDVRLTTADCLALYREWVLFNPATRDRIGELRSKTLGCWCHPKPCHGDVLKELADAIGGAP